MIKIERILCPTDLSGDSDEALRYAVALAGSYHSKLSVCHCLESQTPEPENLRNQIKLIIDDAINKRVSQIGPAKIEYEVILIDGDPRLAISQTAAERQIDLVVMRSRRRPLAAALLGSTAEAICRTAPCPVLITHPEEREWKGLNFGKIDPRKILVAYDFSTDSELAMIYGILLAQEYQSELHLIHVLPYSHPPDMADLPAGEVTEFQDAAQRLQNAIPSETFLWCDIKQAVRSGQPYREILTYADENAIDLICMGVHGAGFSMHALFGSNTDRVLRQAPCPVMIARPLKPAGAVAGR